MSQPDPALRALGAIRDHRMRVFGEALAKLRDERFGLLRKRRPVVVGVQLSIGDGSNPHGSRFDLPTRVQLMRKGGGGKPEIVRVVPDTMLDFEPGLAEVAGVEIELHPFYWGACGVLVDGDLEDWTHVLAWFEAWFDREDAKPADASGQAPVIFDMSEPELTDQGVHFVVDLGAAPVACFVELIEALTRQGLTSIRVGAFG